MPAVRKAAPAPCTRINVDRDPYGFAIGDVVVVAPENGDRKCALSQISAAPASSYVMVAGGAGFRYNNGSLGDSYRGAATRIFNLGPAAALSFHTWSTANGFLRLRATDMAGAGAAAVTVADDIVAIKAQYGFDTRTDLASLVNPVLRVDRWSATMVDADGDGVAGSAGDYAQVAALRIAVIARSKSRDMLKRADGTCQATPAAPVVFGTQEPQGVTAVPISVDVALPGDTIDWHCYRYRVFETIVPLRNTRWRP
jgi:type IV pilus assembly protein PilW